MIYLLKEDQEIQENSMVGLHILVYKMFYEHVLDINKYIYLYFTINILLITLLGIPYNITMYLQGNIFITVTGMLLMSSHFLERSADIVKINFGYFSANFQTS